MKRTLLIGVLCLVILLSSCGVDAEPLEKPNIEDFEELYVGDDFTVFVKSEIDPNAMYYKPAIGFGYGEDTCYVSGYEMVNYMFLYKGEYYNINEFNKFRMVTCEDLTEMGVNDEFDK